MAGHVPAIIGGIASIFGGSSANRQRRREAARNREFQRMMSSTAYQRQTRDLEAAGLNRILGYTKGGPASTPGGAMAQQQDIITPAITTALQTKRLTQEIKNMKAIENKTVTERALISQQYNVSAQNELFLIEQIKLLQKQQPGASAESDLWKHFQEQGGTAKGILRFLPLLKGLR